MKYCQRVQVTHSCLVNCLKTYLLKTTTILLYIKICGPGIRAGLPGGSSALRGIDNGATWWYPAGPGWRAWMARFTFLAPWWVWLEG